MSKIAIIDMGTNTFHLLLAETETPDGYDILLRDHRVVKIGKGGINEGIISEAAARRAIAAMKEFSQTIDANDVSAVYAIGTSAFRNARNGVSLAREIQSLTSISIHIISGDHEAQLIFAGIQGALDLGNESSLIMDIGAGSVEFIIGNRTSVLWKQSVEIGGQRLLERFQKHDPILSEERKALESHFIATLQPLLQALGDFNPKVLVGSSGTFDTLSEIYCLRNGINYDGESPETPLTIDGFHEIWGELISKNREERMNMDGMIEMRVDMIVVASCLIRFVLERHSFDSIRVSTYSLKEGVLSMLARGRSPLP